ncbi:alkaline phosphatase, partial [Vibrio vulnificus]
KAGEYKGKTLEEQAKERGFNIVRDAKSLDAVTVANQDKPVLGLFHDGNMAVAWEGPKATHYGNINNPPLECKPNAKLDPNAPTLAQMTQKA